AARRCAELEDAGAGFDEIYPVISGENAKKMYDHGELDAGIVACGQGIGMVKDIPTVQELLDRMMAEAREAVERIQ
ncbi:MAG: nitronate monooxygenase, partial [Desulfobacterales bacterium]|nr:nitronate monooxygenase [Desulfobacterales bacterium]